MTLKRCAWHRLRLLAFTGVSPWRPLSRLQVSDGLCPWCARRLLKVIDVRGRQAG
jgi:hypothetical protein